VFALAAFSIFFAVQIATGLESQLKRFIDVLAAVEENAAEPVDPAAAFYTGAIPGMLQRLDPYSVFFDAAQFQQLQELERSTRKGFGSVVSVLPGRVVVLQTLPGTPSARSGLEPGDEIRAINGIRLDFLGLDQLIALLSESRQRPVSLDVRKPGSSRLVQITMTPQEVATASVDLAFLLAEGAGYVRVKSFEAETPKQLREAIEMLGGSRLEALVLDLRDNPGGLMPAALEIAAMFLPPKSLLVSVRGRGQEREQIRVPDGFASYSFRLAVLINERSASGSEILAGALQDHDRAVIVGTASFGKGLVQSVYPLSAGTGLALTTAFYYTPSGRSIQKPFRNAQLAGKLADRTEREEYRTDSGRLVTGGGGIQPDHVVLPEAPTRLRMVLEATGSFTSFATEALRKLRPLPPDFEVSPGLLDEFQAYLAQRNIQPSVSEWSADREWIRSRLQQEIFNQAFGVAKGDEVEIRRDPLVRKAMELLRSPAR
jgi:carboxyl-terminal processing protease